MRTKTQKGYRKLAVFLTPDEDGIVLQESKIKAGIPKQEWLAQAVRERIARAKTGEPETGEYAGLSGEDVRRVRLVIATLLAAAEDPGNQEIVRAAIDSPCVLYSRLAAGRA